MVDAGDDLLFVDEVALKLLRFIRIRSNRFEQKVGFAPPFFLRSHKYKNILCLNNIYGAKKLK